MRKPRRGLKTRLYLLPLVLIGTLAARTVFAAEAASGAHGDGKASAPSGEVSGERSYSKENAGEGAAKVEARPSHGDDNQGHQSVPPGHSETTKEVGPSVPTGNDSRGVDANIAPSRRLDKKTKKIGEGNSTIQSQATRNLPRRMSPRPQAPTPVHNAIGVAMPAHENVGGRDSVHPSLAAPHTFPAVTPAVPGSAAGRLSKIEGSNHPVPNPIITSPAVNRGAINGTGITRRGLGPPRIGGPAASVAGINGTTIRSKR